MKVFFIALLATIFICVPAYAQNETKPVLTGIDVLVAQKFAPLRGKRIGLVTNQTGITRDGKATIDVLAKAPGVKLVAVFAPEHGVRGTAPAGQRVASTRDHKTGLPVYSLYGGTTKPTAKMLSGINALVFDLQDIGARSYTYISTMGKCMEACAERKIPFIVLDRPNLIGGNRVEGNLTESNFRSFIGAYPIPYCHGLTVGELARYINYYGLLPGKKRCTLSVISMRNYRRTMTRDEMNLPWRRTSPNIPDADTPLYYAATGIAGELPSLSIGVGTGSPFKVVGAPDINAEKLAADMKRRKLSGYSFEAARWTPARGVYARRQCNGVLITIEEPDKAQLSRLNFEVLDAIRRVAPRKKLFGVSRAKDKMFDLACGTNRVRRAFLQKQNASQMWKLWNTAATNFKKQRAIILLYS